MINIIMNSFFVVIRSHVVEITVDCSCELKFNDKFHHFELSVSHYCVL
jgi:hypothetical protein